MAAALLYRTRMCKYYKTKSCFKGPDCVFAHSEAELRPTSRSQTAKLTKTSVSIRGKEATPAPDAPEEHDAAHWRPLAPPPEDLGPPMMPRKNTSYNSQIPSSSLSTTSSSQSKHSEARELVAPPPPPLLSHYPPPFPYGAAAPPPLLNPSILVCHGVPCLKGLDLDQHARLSNGVPLDGRGEVWALGLPPLSMEGFQRSLCGPYDL